MGTKAKQLDLRDIVTSYPDFPKPGILFRDINPVFKRNDALNHITDEFYRRYGRARVDVVAGIESRGFIIATALALKFGKGVVMVRKAGKLPGKTLKRSYDIEYGSATMELQQNAISKGENVLIADDLIATGGTAAAAAQLVEELGGKVAGFAFIIELSDMRGADRLRKMGYKVQSLVTYHGE
ncbi:MAG: adenine phosphoribosyltransferase [Thaumarchaeota archaeon]|nr:MAG: adenine phosphoribosyltransferase [Nitrososphaerota archaeon]TLY08413.1 MAG: adenine phosphoribosyltransferase [Nitrososphaerota archaeon]TLY11993.1 MAG: adenine phosphoribosyltransferase [Nitrososphaerota archaeon]